jgi:putative redox protein
MEITMSVSATRKITQRAFEIQAKQHKVLTDVTEKLGGKDIAPDPHDYLNIALAGCTAITLTMYAERKQIPLEDVDVIINITAEGDTNTMTRDIRLKGNLTDEQKQQLLDIANKCPIHKFLEKGAQVTSKLLD